MVKFELRSQKLEVFADAKRSELQLMSTEPSSFFHTMFRSKASYEVKVCDAFAACFAKSAVFRRLVLKVICRSCGVAADATESWSCRREEGRLDIELIPPKGAGIRNLIVEAKVAARLSLGQLLKYQGRHPRKKVVALTKRFPEVKPALLAKHGIALLRWQDLHRVLNAPNDGNHIDRFLCEEFGLYLEELNMAHREVTADDIRKMTKLFDVIRREKNDVFKTRSAAAFNAALTLLTLLDAVLRGALETQPKLKSWKRWGPSYFRWEENPGGKTFTHRFGFVLKDRRSKHEVEAAIRFADGGHPASWVVECSAGGNRQLLRRSRKLKDVCKGDALDPEEMRQMFMDDLRAAGILENPPRRPAAA